MTIELSEDDLHEIALIWLKTKYGVEDMYHATTLYRLDHENVRVLKGILVKVDAPKTTIGMLP